MSPHLRLSDLIQAFGSPGNRPETVAILRAYFDASHDPEVFVVAGYVGDAKEWARVEKAWSANLAKWRLDSFHLASIRHAKGTEADACVLSFGEIIKQSELYGISAGIERSWWRARKGESGSRQSSGFERSSTGHASGR